MNRKWDGNNNNNLIYRVRLGELVDNTNVCGLHEVNRCLAYKDTENTTSRTTKTVLYLQLGPSPRNILHRLPPPEPKQIRGHLPHLNLLASLRDPVPAMVPPDMLEGHLPRISHAAVDLYGAVGRLTAQPVGPVIAHADLVAQLTLHVDVRHRVHLPRRLADQKPQHLRLRRQLHQRELDPLVVGERRAEGCPSVRVLDGCLDAERRRAERRGCLSDAVLVHEGLRDGEPFVHGAYV